MLAGRGYTIFDTTVGRCGIAWGHAGIVGVQLPEAREIETRRRMLRQYPDAKELRPPPEVEIAIEGIVALLRGQACDFSDVTLDMQVVTPFNRRVYGFVRAIREARQEHLPKSPSASVHPVPRTRSARRLRETRSPSWFPVIACSRPPARPTASAPMAAASPSAGCCRSKAPAAPAARRCSTCCFPLLRRAAPDKIRPWRQQTLLQHGAISVSDFRCSAGPDDQPFVELHSRHSISYVRKGSFGCRTRGRSFELVAGSILVGHPGDEYVCTHDHHICGDECLSFALAPELVDRIGGKADVWRTGCAPPLPELMVLGELAQAVSDGRSDIGLDEVGVAFAARFVEVVSGARARSRRERCRAIAAARWKPRCGSTRIRINRSISTAPRASRTQSVSFSATAPSKRRSWRRDTSKLPRILPSRSRHRS